MKKFILVFLVILVSFLLTSCLVEEDNVSLLDNIIENIDSVSDNTYVDIESLPIEERKEKYEHMDLITLYYPDGSIKELEVYYSIRNTFTEENKVSYNVSLFDNVCLVLDGVIYYKDFEDYYNDSDISFNVFSGTFDIKNIR